MDTTTQMQHGARSGPAMDAMRLTTSYLLNTGHAIICGPAKEAQHKARQNQEKGNIKTLNNDRLQFSNHTLPRNGFRKGK